MNLGEAVFKMIAGRTPRREESIDAQVSRAKKEAGGVSQLARALGISRTTVQKWGKGSTPSLESQELIRAVLRRADLREAREARLSAANTLVVKGRHDGRPRTINLGPYLAPGTIGRAVEAYLRGASARELHVVVYSGITDKPYRWMFQPPGGFAQQPAGDQVRQAARAVTGGSGGGGRPRGGSDDDDLGYEEDESEPDYDEYVDLDYEGYAVDTNDGYEFGASGASAS